MKRQEIIEEIARKKKDEEELKQYIKAKIKSEKIEILKFKEQEIQENRRIKEIQKVERQKELMDEVKRNIEKSELVKSVLHTFENSFVDISNF